MLMNRLRSGALVALACAAFASLASAADYPAAKPGEWIARDFKFHTGEVMSGMRIAYRTIGEPSGEPVLVLHGTTGSGASMLTGAFASELFGVGQALDAKKYFIILPDAVGHGGSAKPSDGLRTKFPRYNYDDMVAAQYRLLTEHLGIRHVRLIIGNSMGGMETWTWGTTHPDFADVLVPMAAQPTAMSSRNWILRRMLIEAVQRDPDYKDGNYTTPPKSLTLANAFFALATSGGNIAMQKAAPTSDKGDEIVKARLAATLTADANDYIYQWASSRDFDTSAKLERINATVLAINAADDERNPPETGLMAKAMEKVKNGRLLLIPASEQTTGHGTTGNAKFYAKELGELLQTAPRRAM
jgi:homoserine O-acetyltransferase/O-succinyltransferase